VNTRYYVSFPDGVPAFDCTRCGSLCCKSGALVFDSKCRRLIERHWPDLSWLIDRRGDGNMMPMGDVCWFLVGTQCAIEKRFSHEAKPASCRFHPVKIAREPGDWVILSLAPCPTLHITAANGLRHAETVALATELLSISGNTTRSGYPQIDGQLDKKLSSGRWDERIHFESLVRDCFLDYPTLSVDRVLRRYHELLVVPREEKAHWVPGDFNMTGACDAEIITLLVPTARVGSLFLALPLEQANIMTWCLVKHYIDIKHSIWPERNSVMRAWHLATEITDCEIVLKYATPSWRDDAEPSSLNEDAQRLLSLLDGMMTLAAALDKLRISDYSERLRAARFIRRAWRRGSVQLM
jgi:Fe-S-cluster containining protein/uncharacterized protein YbdZ (MbtH family)